MASLQSMVDAVRAAVSSSTCTPASATILSDLLLPKANTLDSTILTDTKSKPKAAGVVKAVRAAASKRVERTKAGEIDIATNHAQLSPKERLILATEVVNLTLRSLNEAIKGPPPPSIRRKASSKDVVKASARQALRRSNSLPQSPLQPRCLNRVSSSPSISSRTSRSSSSASLAISGHRSTAECARVAFACMRTLQSSRNGTDETPNLQIENGMSALIGKLVTLGLDDLAAKEIRILKRRLQSLESQSTTKKGVSLRGKTSTSTPETLGELLDFGPITSTGATLELIIATQLQILRLLTSSKKRNYVEAALPVLHPSHSSSPTGLIIRASKESHLQEKHARRLQALSDLLLSLSPSVSSGEDAIALDERLSVDPATAFELQTLALHNRFLWWGIAGHQGDIEKELFDPFLRCLSTFQRRSQCTAAETYCMAYSCFSDLQTLVSDSNASSHLASVTALVGIYQSLGSMAEDADLIDEAIGLIEKVQAVMGTQRHSHARRTSVFARLVALKLRKMARQSRDEELLLRLLEDLEQPFKGDSSEVDGLLVEVSGVRRAAIAALSANKSISSGNLEAHLTDGMRQMCESLILMYPRLSLRYLGNPPDLKSATKDIVRHEQRRHFITKPSLHAIESTLHLVKVLVGEGRMTWEVMDSKLQETLNLLDRLDMSLSNSSASDGSTTPPYYVRISNLYYTQFLNMRRDADPSKIGHTTRALRAIRRCISCLRTRSASERRSARLSMKLERMAEFCKSLGRYDELLSTLLSLRDEMVGNKVLSAVATNLAYKPVRAAWYLDDATCSLARTIRSITKVQLKFLDSTSTTSLIDGAWSHEERGAVLEQILDLLLGDHSDSTSASHQLQLKVLHDLLASYDEQQYPIRRLRVFYRLLSAGTPVAEQITEKSQLNEYAQRIVISGTSDEGLQRYLLHYQTIITTTLELQKESPSAECFQLALAVWSSIRDKCDSLEALEHEIEDVQGLLAHLRVMADFTEMKGFDTTRIAVLRLIAEINELTGVHSIPDDLVNSSTDLALQWLHLGYSRKAGLALNRAERYSNENGVTSFVLQQLHLSYANYFLVIGNSDKSEVHLRQAQAIFSQENDGGTDEKTLRQHLRRNCLSSHAYSVHSMLALERGTSQLALTHAKQSVRLLRRAWTITEEQLRRKSNWSDLNPLTAVEMLTDEVSNLSMSTVAIPIKDQNINTSCGSCFWPLVAPLFRSLSHLSEVYAHQGMFQETIYYAEQAYKLVKEIGSEAHLALASAYVGNAWMRAGELEKGSEFLMTAKKLSSTIEQSQNAVVLMHYLGRMHSRLGDKEAELAACTKAEETLKNLATTSYISTIGRPAESPLDLEKAMSLLAISKDKTPAPKRAAPRAKMVAKAKPAIQIAKSAKVVVSSVAEECTQLSSLKAKVLRQKAQTLISMKRITEANNLLDEAHNYAIRQVDIMEAGLTMAKHLLLQSFEQMHRDPVYSVLQESTISFPSIVGFLKSDKNNADRISIARHSPPRKTQGSKKTRERGGSKSPAPDSFFDKLRQAHERLMEIYPMAIQVAPLSVVHTISTLLNTVAILLSAAGQVTSKPLAHPGFSSSSIELARNLALRQERRSIQADVVSKSKPDDRCWPSLAPADTRRPSLGSTYDITQFQRDYVDIIPKSWTAISISLSDSCNELSISKLQAGHSSFVLRLPLGRNNSIDADEEVFGFEQGRSELMKIIELANESAHDARDKTGRQAKTAWWKEREALDAQLRDLLENIEKVWLGGFTGIFSQHSRRSDLLARFQKSFTNILDKHLPSRQKNAKRNVGPRVTLDSRILDLFIGLGDVSHEASDFSEPLTDLLYFVVDALQFYGELNAYAEIDFDSIVVETHAALCCYYEAARSSSQQDEERHTILILDKALHAFPWESLPCMNGQAVSRLPSLGCLRDRIIQAQDDAPENCPQGRYIDRHSGSYILNPSGDLKNTQAAFQKSLEGLDKWHGVVAREPSEDELKQDLVSKDLVLYFGHGSGAQYIRAREIKKLEKCAVTVLMGCSSGALTEVGEFEPYGPPINYMHAECPALVATLWDVTDKDIDRFAKSTFEHWGLFESEEISKGKRGKGKGKGKDGKDDHKVSLVEAVARGKEACTLRYLNAAAVCVYGIPAYFK